jgi:hypothetical protein
MGVNVKNPRAVGGAEGHQEDNVGPGPALLHDLGPPTRRELEVEARRAPGRARSLVEYGEYGGVPIG